MPINLVTVLEYDSRDKFSLVLLLNSPTLDQYNTNKSKIGN